MTSIAKTKIPIVKIILDRVEGPTYLCGKRTVSTFAEAETQLRTWEWTSPGPDGGYDKIDFTLIFADGEEYKGRYDLNQGRTADMPTLACHVDRHMRFYAGLLTASELPSRLDMGSYRALLKLHTNEGQAEADARKKWLETYDLDASYPLRSLLTY